MALGSRAGSQNWSYAEKDESPGAFVGRLTERLALRGKQHLKRSRTCGFGAWHGRDPHSLVTSTPGVRGGVRQRGVLRAPGVKPAAGADSPRWRDGSPTPGSSLRRAGAAARRYWLALG